jgi:alpha-L-fucosidase 2
MSVYFRVSPAIRTALIFMLTFAPQLLAALHAEMLENIEYGLAGSTPLSLDARIPEGNGPFPAAIIVHGGAWVAGDRTKSVAPLFQPLADAHIATFSISYRLAKPGHEAFSLPANLTQILTFGLASEDVRHAVAFVKEHAAEYRVDPDRIALIGESAGAQLAAMAALRPGHNGAVRAVVALYCPSDLAKLMETSPWIPDKVHERLQESTMGTMLTAGLRELSPVTWVNKQAPPFLLIHGTGDSFVPFEQSEEFCDRLHAAGGKCELYKVKDGGHGLKNWESDKQTKYKEHMVKWLEKELK